MKSKRGRREGDKSLRHFTTICDILPVRKGSPAPSCGAQSQPRCSEQHGRLMPTNRPGRSSGHTPKPAKLPRGVWVCELFSGHTQGPLNGGVANGGVSRSGLVLPFLSFFVLFGTFPIFPGFSRFARGWSGDFPDCPLPLSRPLKSTYEEQSRKGPRHNLDLSQKSGKPPGLEPPRFSFCQHTPKPANLPWESEWVNSMSRH